MAEKLGDLTVVRHTQLTTEKKTFSLNCQLTELEVNEVLKDCSDLISETFKGWHRGQMLRLGRDRYVAIAKEVREQTKVNHKGKLFSKWLKQAV